MKVWSAGSVTALSHLSLPRYPTAAILIQSLFDPYPLYPLYPPYPLYPYPPYPYPPYPYPPYLDADADADASTPIFFAFFNAVSNIKCIIL